MRLLIDNALSAHIARLLIEAGHDATHVRDQGLQAAADPVVFNAAAEEERVLVSADTDFGALLAVPRRAKPSFILLRRTKGLSAKALAMTIDDVVQRFEQELNSGCVITVTQPKSGLESADSCWRVDQWNIMAHVYAERSSIESSESLRASICAIVGSVRKIRAPHMPQICSRQQPGLNGSRVKTMYGYTT